MTEDKITAEVKVKNPKRVEAGKKLAALSKAARLKKQQNQEHNSTTSTSSYSVKYTAIGVAGLLVAVGSLWFAYKSYSGKPSSEAKLTLVTEEQPPKIKTVNHLESL